MIDNSINIGNDYEAEAQHKGNKVSAKANIYNEDFEEEDEMAPFALSIHTDLSTQAKPSSQTLMIDIKEEDVEEKKDINTCSSSLLPPVQSNHPSSSLINSLNEDENIRSSIVADRNMTDNDDSIIVAAAAASAAEASKILQYSSIDENMATMNIIDDSLLNDISSFFVDGETNKNSTGDLDFSQLMKEADNTLTVLKGNEKKKAEIQQQHFEEIEEATPKLCNIDDSANDRLQQLSCRDPLKLEHNESKAEACSLRTGFTRNQNLMAGPSISECNNTVDVRSTSTSSTPMKSNVTFHALSSSNPNIHHRRTNLFNNKTRLSMGLEPTHYKYQRRNGLSSSTESATLTSSHGVSALQIGDDMYKLQVWIPQANLHSVMETVSNIDILRLWCDPILAAVVTKESERASMDREYDGEWIEAATTLRPPSGGGFGLYNFFRTIKTYLGFPNHGSLTLFIERKRGQVSLTIGPLGGYCEVLHTLTFEQCGLGVNIIDCIRVSEENFSKHYSRIKANSVRSDVENLEGHEFYVDDHENTIFSCSCCSLCACMPVNVQRWFLPNIEDHVRQTIKSLTNLKNLIEHGEIVAMNQLYDFDVNDNDGVTPLLAGNRI